MTGVIMLRSLLLLALAAATGCGQRVALVDDVDLSLDFTPLRGPSDALHTPYVQGASMTVFIHTADDDEDTHLWTVESADPTLFAVTDQRHTRDPQTHRWTFSAEAQALREGDTDLIVRDRDHRVVHTRTVEVRLPDQVELLAHGILLIGRPDHEASVIEARINAGGTATYLARYYKAGLPLSGNGALSVMAPANVAAHVEQTFLFEDRDWLQISPADVGNGTIDLIVGGVHVQDLDVIAVPTTDVARISIRGEDESRAHAGEWLVALAEARDAVDRVVYGVEDTWHLHGAQQLGDGDLYPHQDQPRQPHMLSAFFGSMNASAMIHGSGYVDSTNHLGCSYAPHAASGAAAGLFFVGLILLILSRRRA